jgi:molybdopterin-guanine dinucleotide biosynthesis protein A
LGDLTLIDHTIQKLKNRFKEILIISNEERNKDISNVFYSNDVMDGQLGPLVGVLSSMEWIIDNSKNYKWIMTFPCDTPFFKIEIIDHEDIFVFYKKTEIGTQYFITYKNYISKNNASEACDLLTIVKSCIILNLQN